MVDLQTLIFFKTVAECGSFSAASHKLKYAQSNISTKIIRLENNLQTTLFYRNNKGVTLTPKGKLFLDYTDEMLRLLKTAEIAMKDNVEASGSFTIGSSLDIPAPIRLRNTLIPFSSYPSSLPSVLPSSFILLALVSSKVPPIISPIPFLLY